MRMRLKMESSVIAGLRVLAVLGLTALVLAGSGCASGPTTHKEAVNAANQRWRDLRTRLLLQTAQRQFDTGDLEQAEKTLSDAMAIEPADGSLHVLAGRIMLERGHLERAHHFLRAAVSYQPNLPDAHYYEGVVLQRWRQFDAALISYEQAYQLRPDNAAYLLAKCEMLVAVGQVDQALETLLGKLVYFDQNAGLHTAAAQVCMIKKDYRRAAEHFHHAILLRPEDLHLQEELAVAQLAAGDAAKAAAGLEQLLARLQYAQRSDMQRLLARAYEGAARPAAAKAIYIRLTRQDPSDVEAWVRLAEICWTLEDLPGAELAAQRVSALAPQRHEGHLMLGMLAQRRGQVDPALAHLDRATLLAPQLAAPLVLRGLVLEQAGRSDEAVAAYAQALARQPEDSRVRQLLARAEASN